MVIFWNYIQSKNWRFVCLVRHWPGGESFKTEGLLFFPAIPQFDVTQAQDHSDINEFKVLKTISNDYQLVVPSVCSIKLEKELLSFQSIYGDFSINLTKSFNTHSKQTVHSPEMLITTGEKPFVFFNDTKELNEFYIFRFH